MNPQRSSRAATAGALYLFICSLSFLADGFRLLGGKDAASPRYIFTKLPSLTRLIFHPDDDGLLDYLEDDGQAIEPKYYVPVLPMVLINGADGIGTGW